MNRRGFTLVELIVIIAIITTLSTLATIAFNNWQRKANIEKEVKELYADLMSIRQQAVVTGMRHRMLFVSGNNVTIRRFSSELDLVGTQIAQKSLTYALTPSTPPFPFFIDFNSRGMMEPPATQSICVFSDAGPVPDSIVMQQSRISLGKIINQGGACAISNITLQ
jgi:prepilin-type N-terminal cleavage/methylation domain-containing protein